MVLGTLCDVFWTPTDRLGVKIKKTFFVKWSFFFGVFYDPKGPISTHMNGKRMPNSKSAHQITPGGTKNPKKIHMMSSKVIDLWWPRLTSERSQCQCKPWMSPPNTYPCPYHQLKCRMPKFASFRRLNGTWRKFRLTWPWKSGHRAKIIVGTDFIFSEKV